MRTFIALLFTVSAVACGQAAASSSSAPQNFFNPNDPPSTATCGFSLTAFSLSRDTLQPGAGCQSVTLPMSTSDPLFVSLKEGQYIDIVYGNEMGILATVKQIRVLSTPGVDATQHGSFAVELTPLEATKVLFAVNNSPSTLQYSLSLG